MFKNQVQGRPRHGVANFQSLELYKLHPLLAKPLNTRPQPLELSRSWSQAAPLQTLKPASCRSHLRPCRDRPLASRPASPTRLGRAPRRATVSGVSPVAGSGNDCGGQLGGVPGRIRTWTSGKTGPDGSRWEGPLTP